MRVPRVGCRRGLLRRRQRARATRRGVWITAQQSADSLKIFERVPVATQCAHSTAPTPKRFRSLRFSGEPFVYFIAPPYRCSFAGLNRLLLRSRNPRRRSVCVQFHQRRCRSEVSARSSPACWRSAPRGCCASAAAARNDARHRSRTGVLGALMRSGGQKRRSRCQSLVASPTVLKGTSAPVVAARSFVNATAGPSCHSRHAAERRFAPPSTRGKPPARFRRSLAPGATCAVVVSQPV